MAQATAKRATRTKAPEDVPAVVPAPPTVAAVAIVQTGPLNQCRFCNHQWEGPRNRLTCPGCRCAYWDAEDIHVDHDGRVSYLPRV